MDEEPLSTSFKWSFPTSPHFIKEIIIGIILVICLGIPIHVATEYPHVNSGSADLLEDESENDEINIDGGGRRRRGNSRGTSLSRHEATEGEPLQSLLLRPHSRKFVPPLPPEERYRDNGCQEGVKVTSGGIASKHMQQVYPALDERLQHRWNEACETARRETVIRRQEMVGLPRCHSENRSRLGQQMGGARSSDTPRSPRPRSVPSSPVATQGAKTVCRRSPRGGWGSVCFVPWPTNSTLGMDEDCNSWRQRLSTGVFGQRDATTMSCFTSGIILSDCGCIASVQPPSVAPLHLPNCLPLESAPEEEPPQQLPSAQPESSPLDSTSPPLQALECKPSSHSAFSRERSQSQSHPSPPPSQSQSQVDVSPPRNPIITSPNTDIDEQSEDSYVSEEKVTVRNACIRVTESGSQSGGLENTDPAEPATFEEFKNTSVSERIIQNLIVDPPHPLNAPDRSDISIYYDSEDGASSPRNRGDGNKEGSSSTNLEEAKNKLIRPLSLKGGRGSLPRMKPKIQPRLIKTCIQPGRTVGTQATGSRGLFLCEIKSDSSDDTSSDDISMVTSRSTASVRTVASQIHESMLDDNGKAYEPEFVSCIDICPKCEIPNRQLSSQHKKGKLFSRHSETHHSDNSVIARHPESLISNQVNERSVAQHISNFANNNSELQQTIYRHDTSTASPHEPLPVLNQPTELLAQLPTGEKVYKPNRDVRGKVHSRHSRHDKSASSRLKTNTNSRHINPSKIRNDVFSSDSTENEVVRFRSNVRITPTDRITPTPRDDESLKTPMRRPVTAPTRIPSPPPPLIPPLPTVIPSQPPLPHPVPPLAFSASPLLSPWAPAMRLREDLHQTPSQATLSCALSPSRAMMALQALSSHTVSHPSSPQMCTPPLLAVRRSLSAATRDCNSITDSTSFIQSERSASFMSLRSSSSSSHSSMSTTSMGPSACALARLRLSTLARRPMARALRHAMRSDALLRHARSSSGDWGGAGGSIRGDGGPTTALTHVLPVPPASAPAADNIERKGQQLFKRSRQMVWRLTNRTRAFRERLRLKYGWATNNDGCDSSASLRPPLENRLNLRSNSSRGDSGPSFRNPSLRFHPQHPPGSEMNDGSPSPDFSKFSGNRKSSPWDSQLYTKFSPTLNTGICPAEIDAKVNREEKTEQCLRRVPSTEGRSQLNFSSELRKSTKNMGNICSQESTTKRFVHRVSRHVRHTYKYVADVSKEARKRESFLIRTEREETVRNLSRQEDSGCSYATASAPRTDCNNCIRNESNPHLISKDSTCMNNQSATTFNDWKSALNSLLQPQDGAFKILGKQVVMHCTTPSNIKNVWASTALKKKKEMVKTEANLKCDEESSDNPETNSTKKSSIFKDDDRSKSKGTNGPLLKCFEPAKHKSRAKDRASKIYHCRRSRIEERRELSSDEWQDASERLDSSVYSASGPVTSSSVVRTIRSRLTERDVQTEEGETPPFILPKCDSDTSESEGDANFDSIFKLLLKSSVAYNYKLLGHKNNAYADKASQVILNKVSQKIGRGTSPRRVKDACIGRTKRMSDTCDNNQERESGREDNCNTMELISSIPSSLVANDSPSSANADTNDDTRAILPGTAFYEVDSEVREKSSSVEKRVWVSDSGLKEKKGREALMEALVNVCRDATGLSCKYKESRGRRHASKLASSVEKTTAQARSSDQSKPTSSRAEITPQSPSTSKKECPVSPSTPQVAVSTRRSSVISSQISRKSPPCLRGSLHKSGPSLVCKSRSLRLSISYARDSLRNVKDAKFQNISYSATVSKENIPSTDEDPKPESSLSQGSKETDAGESDTSSKPSLKVLTMMASKPQKSSSQMLFMIPKPREHDSARRISSSSIPDKRVVQRAINSAISKLREIMCSEEFRGRLKMEANAAIAIAVSAARNTAKNAVEETTRKKKRRTPLLDRIRDSKSMRRVDGQDTQVVRTIELKTSGRMKERMKSGKKRDKRSSSPRQRSNSHSPSVSHSQTSVDDMRDDVSCCGSQYEKSIGDELEKKAVDKVDKVKHLLGDISAAISRESLKLLDKCSTSGRFPLPCEGGVSIAVESSGVKGSPMLTSCQRNIQKQVLHELGASKDQEVSQEEDSVHNSGNYIHVRRSRGLLTIAQGSQGKIKKNRINISSRNDIKEKKEELSEERKNIEMKSSELERKYSKTVSEKSKDLIPTPTKSQISSKHKSSVVILHPRKKSFIENITFKTDSDQSGISVTSDTSDMKSEMDPSYNVVQQLAVVQEETERYDTDGGTDPKITKINITCRSQSTQVSEKKTQNGTEENSPQLSERISQHEQPRSAQMVDHSVGNSDTHNSCTSSFPESCQAFKNKEPRSSTLIHQCTQTSISEKSESVRSRGSEGVKSSQSSSTQAGHGTKNHSVRNESEVQFSGGHLTHLQTKGNQTEDISSPEKQATEPVVDTCQSSENELSKIKKDPISEPSTVNSDKYGEIMKSSKGKRKEKMKSQATQWLPVDDTTEESRSRKSGSKKVVSTKSKSTQWETPKEDLGVQYTSSQATISLSIMSPSTLSHLSKLQRTKSTKSQSTQWETPKGSMSQPSKYKNMSSLWSRYRPKRGSSTSTQSTEWSLPKSGSQKTGSTMSLTSSNKSLKIHSTKSQALDKKLYRKISTLSQPIGKPVKQQAMRLLTRKTPVAKSARSQSVGPTTSSLLQSESHKSESLKRSDSFSHSSKKPSPRSRSLGTRPAARCSLGNLSLKEHSKQTSSEDPNVQTQSSGRNLQGNTSTESYSRKEKSDRHQYITAFVKDPTTNIHISRKDRHFPNREATNQTQSKLARSRRIDIVRGKIQRPRLEKVGRENAPLRDEDQDSYGKTQSDNSGETVSVRQSSVKFSHLTQSSQTQPHSGKRIACKCSTKEYGGGLSFGKQTSIRQSPSRLSPTKQSAMRPTKIISAKPSPGKHSPIKPSPQSPARQSPSRHTTKHLSPERSSLDNRPSSVRQSLQQSTIQQFPSRTSDARNMAVTHSHIGQSPSRPRSRRQSAPGNSSGRTPADRSLSAQRSSLRWLERMASGRLSAKHSLSKSMGRNLDNRSLSKIFRNNESPGETLSKKPFPDIPNHVREILGRQEQSDKISKMHEPEKRLTNKMSELKTNLIRKLPRSQSLDVGSQGRSSWVSQSKDSEEDATISVSKIIPRTASSRLESLKEHIVQKNSREKSLERRTKEKVPRVMEPEVPENREKLKMSLKIPPANKDEPKDASRVKQSTESSSAKARVSGKDPESNKPTSAFTGKRDFSRVELRRECTGRPSRSRESYHRKLSIHQDYVVSQRRSTSRRLIRDLFQFSEVSQGIPSEIESTKCHRNTMSPVLSATETTENNEAIESHTQVASKSIPESMPFKVVTTPIGQSDESTLSPSDEEVMNSEEMGADTYVVDDSSCVDPPNTSECPSKRAVSTSSSDHVPVEVPKAEDTTTNLKTGRTYGSSARYSVVDHGRTSHKPFREERTHTNIQSSSLSLSDALAPAPHPVSRTTSPGRSEPSSGLSQGPSSALSPGLSPGPSSGLSPGTSFAPSTAPTPTGTSMWPSPELSVEPSSGTSLALSPGPSLAPSLPSLHSSVSSHSLPPSRTYLPGSRRAHAHLRTRSASPSAAVGMRAGVRHDSATGCREAFREVCVVTPKRVDVFRLICRMPPQPFSGNQLPLDTRESFPHVVQSFRLPSSNGSQPLLRVRIRSRSLSSARASTLIRSHMRGRSLSTSSTRSPRVPKWPPAPPPAPPSPPRGSR